MRTPIAVPLVLITVVGILWLAPAGVVHACDPLKAIPGCALGSTAPEGTRGDYNPDWARAHMNGLNGMSAVAQFYMEMSKWTSDADRIWKEALDWIVAHAKEGDPEGVMWQTWEELAGYTHVHGHPTAAWNAAALAEGYARLGNPEYRAAAVGAMQWLLSDYYPTSQFLPGAEGCIFIEPYPDVLPPHHMYNNSTYAQAGIGQGALATFRFTGAPEALEVAECVADQLMDCAFYDAASNGYKWSLRFPIDPGDSTAIVGRCAGTVGILEYFLELVKTFPFHPEYDEYARGALRWLMAMAVLEPGAAHQPAMMWPAAETPDPTYLEVIGGGAAGVGRAFLMAYDVYGEDVYLDYARAAGNWLIHVAEPGPVPNTLRWHDDGYPDFNTMHCRGESGIMSFFAHLYDASQQDLYGLIAAKAALWILHWTQPTDFGPMYPFEPGGDYVATDFWWSSLGIANSFYTSLPDVAAQWPLRDVYLYPMNFLYNCKIVEDGGFTWNIHEPFWPGGEAAPATGLDLTQMPLAHDILVNESPEEIASRISPSSWPKPASRDVTIRTVLPAGSHFASTSGPPEGSCRLHILNVAGRRVATLNDPASSWERVEGGNLQLLWHWDGRADSGRQVPEGVYLAQLYHGGQPAGGHARILMLR